MYKAHLNRTVELTPGVLLNDVAKIGTILYPDKDKLIGQVGKEFDFLDTVENVADIRPWNLLFTSKGLKFIDYQYSDDLSTDLHYDKNRDVKIISNYLEELFSRPQPIILIDGVFFQLYQTGIARVWTTPPM